MPHQSAARVLPYQVRVDDKKELTHCRAMSLETCLHELPSPDKPLVATQLVHLSNLGPEEMLGFIEAWESMETDRRRKAISMLADLAEDNIDLDFSAIYRHAIHDEDEEVRITAVSGLWECEERSLIDPLIRLMNDDEVERVRAAAAQAVGRFAMLAETGKLLDRDHGKIADALLAVIDAEGETVEVRRRAIEAVAPMSLPRVPEAIMEAYDDGDLQLKASAIFAMGVNCDPKWIPVLLTELDSRDSELCYEAVGALSEVGDEDVVPRLVQLLRDPDSQVQAAAVSAIGSIGGPVAKTALTHALQHADTRVQELAEATLRSMAFGEDPLDTGADE